MSEPSQELQLLNRLRLPEPDLKGLSFCPGPTPKHVRQWVESLPLTRTSFVSAVLYSALPELARLKTDGQSHLQMLETVRPAVQACVVGLSKSFLNQPLILPEPARKAATIAQALQKHLSNAYLATVRDTLQSRCPDGQKALAIHRSVTGLGLLLLRSYQLYIPSMPQLWRELHTLYELAELAGLTEVAVDDPLPGHERANTISLAYRRLVLMGACRPNQLRQNDLRDIYNALETLAGTARIEPGNATIDNVYALMLDSDAPPVYRSRLDLYDSAAIRQLDTSATCQALKDKGKAGTGLPEALIQHALDAWGKPAVRGFERRPGQGQLEVTVGLTNMHFHIAGETPFNLFLRQPSDLGLEDSEQGLFARRGVQLKDRQDDESDPWGQAFDVARPGMTGSDRATTNIEENIRRSARSRYRGQHPIHRVEVMDVSAGGYCLEWQQHSPQSLKAGEVLGIREPGRYKWAIAAIRWVRQKRGATQMGVQLLAPQAQPAAAGAIQKTGEFAEYLRVLLLPTQRLANQPASLITNALSFREHQKIKLYHKDTVNTAQLTRRIFSTGSISQFSFKTLQAMDEPAKPAAPQSVQDVAALWDRKD